MSKKFTDMTDQELKDLAQSCHASVEQDCFSTRDVINVEASCSELERRGYEIDDTRAELVVHKAGKIPS